MSGRNRQEKTNTVVLPEICDVDVELLEVAINYEKQNSREWQNRKEKKPLPKAGGENEQRDDAGEANGHDNDQEAAGAVQEAAGAVQEVAGVAVKKVNKK